jgi:hypothetical protein
MNKNEESLSFNNLPKESYLTTEIVTCKSIFIIPESSITNKDDLEEMGRRPHGDLAEEVDLDLFRGGVSVDLIWDTPAYEKTPITDSYIAPAFSIIVLKKASP